MPPTPPPESTSGNEDGDIIMHKIPKDGAVKAAWINTILKGRKQLLQEKSSYFCNNFPVCLIN